MAATAPQSSTLSQRAPAFIPSSHHHCSSDYRQNNCSASESSATSNDEQRHYLTEEELATFRTSVCDNIRRYGRCDKQDSCPHSHCLAWQRRDPFTTPYWPELCPNITFVKQGGKMRLVNNCSHRRRCKYAHSKEESLYHPLTYKMKRCLVKPHCNRHFCPFAHSDAELRDPAKVLYAPPTDGFAPSVSSQKSSPSIGAHSTPLKSPAPHYPVVPTPCLLSPCLPPAASGSPTFAPPPGFTEEDRSSSGSARHDEEPFISVPLSVLLPILSLKIQPNGATDGAGIFFSNRKTTTDSPPLLRVPKSVPLSAVKAHNRTSEHESGPFESSSIFFSTTSSESSSPHQSETEWARVAAAFRG